MALCRQSLVSDLLQSWRELGLGAAQVARAVHTGCAERSRKAAVVMVAASEVEWEVTEEAFVFTKTVQGRQTSVVMAERICGEDVEDIDLIKPLQSLKLDEDL